MGDKGVKMADPQHFEMLKKGVLQWNIWRQRNLSIKPVLNGLILDNEDFSNANFHNTNFYYSDLRQTKFRNANLTHTEFSQNDMQGADFTNANLSYADLGEADLSFADLTNANLSNTTIQGASFSNANMSGTNLTNARIGWISFENQNFRNIQGLETIEHTGPSYISVNSIFLSEREIPEVFLRGIGLPEIFVEYARSLAYIPIRYNSCFISYSNKDEKFARKLYKDLGEAKITCWFAPENLKWGEKIHKGINQAIYQHDKLLLIISKNSLASGWVEKEIEIALIKEKNENRTVLLPIRIDKAIEDCPFPWASKIRHERNIGDFSRWKTQESYEKAFARLLHDLSQSDE